MSKENNSRRTIWLDADGNFIPKKKKPRHTQVRTPPPPQPEKSDTTDDEPETEEEKKLNKLEDAIFNREDWRNWYLSWMTSDTPAQIWIPHPKKSEGEKKIDGIVSAHNPSLYEQDQEFEDFLTLLPTRRLRTLNRVWNLGYRARKDGSIKHCHPNNPYDA